MADIVQLLQNRDEKGLSLLYDRYAPALLGIIVGIVKSQKLGEEVLQQSLLKVWNNVQNYDMNKGNFFTWMAAIARNSAIDQVRLKGHQVRSSTVSIDQDIQPSEVTYVSTADIDAADLLSRLDKKYKEVLDMIYLQGYTHQDAATTLNIPLGTVKTRLRYAINALRDQLKGEKDLFLGVFALITLLILFAWIY